jgi:hypothetical protein
MPKVNYLVFDGYESFIDCGSDGALDNLPQGANGFTAECWINIRAWSEFFDHVHMLEKSAVTGGNWAFRIIRHNDYSLDGWIREADDGGTGEARVDTDDFRSLYDFQIWHHLAMTFNFYGDKKIHIWINGAEPAVYYNQTAMADSPMDDAANKLYLGNEFHESRGMSAWLGWARISDSVRYTTPFTPLPRCALPAIDGNTVAQWIGTEPKGAVTTVDNQEGTAALDGTPNLLERVSDCPNPGTFLKGVRVGP